MQCIKYLNSTVPDVDGAIQVKVTLDFKALDVCVTYIEWYACSFYSIMSLYYLHIRLTDAEDTPEQLRVFVPEGKDENVPIGVVVPAVRACIKNPLKSSSPWSRTV